MLDIGCGSRWQGDVNMDLFTKSSSHRPGHPELDPHLIQNFVLADAHALPFRTGSFNRVRASHILEHLPRPLVALGEWLRVGRRVEVNVPFRNGLFDPWNGFLHKFKVHLWSFNKTWFLEYARRQRLGVTVSYGHGMGPFPNEVKAWFVRQSLDEETSGEAGGLTDDDYEREA